ncbi:T9SS type A sorting domain-containing protein [Neolewinella agarilytica]|uniref:T9SS type A sorting domain-containing protein n=1 Tax=Neolewinella agarilytica TaxID=478744 RepID=UPI002353E72B|nr:T9SS type A sorting domain-containing protein [Neolewinella agarilytica]
MKFRTALISSFLLFTAVISGQAGMTINFDSPCTGSLTLTYTGTDATGRHMYGDESFNGPGNPVFSVFWDQASGTWLAGLFGTGSASDILYATGPNTFSPNPPDSATEPYPATASGCSGSATVSGSGTQSTAGTPCEGIGDDDMDGICNDNDVCPGQDDTLDDDGDNIPDCIDPNPGTFDGVSFDSPCLGGALVFTVSGNDGSRNTYVNTAQGLEIVFDATNDRWEMRGANAGGAVIYFNTLASIPNPPSTLAMAWESEPAGGCSDSPTVGGNGTQDARCAAVCDDGDPCTTDTLDDNCNCNSGPDEEAPTLTGCPSDEQDGVDNGSCMFETPDYTSLITVSDNCTTSTPTLLQIPAAGTLLGSGTFEIKLVATDLEGNASDTCRITLNNADIAPPTAICLQDVEVLIDENGMATLTPADLDAGSTDNCGITNRSLSVTDFTCDDVSTTAISVTLTVEDAAGGQGSCSSSVTVSDNIAPTFDCTDITVSLDATGEYFISNSDIFDRMIQNWDDNCAPAPTNLGSGNRTITCANITNGTFTYFFGAFDGNGQEATCTATITVLDPSLACDDAPTAQCAATAVVQIDADGNADLSSIDDGSSDDNTLPEDLLFSIDGDILDCDDVDMPAQMVTLIVTDNVGQSATCTSMVTVEDNIAPEVTCQNVAYDLDANASFLLFRNSVIQDILTSFSDNCAASSVNEAATQITFGCNDLGINSESMFYRDRPVGPTSQEDRCNVLIQINDPLGVCATPPTLTCNDFRDYIPEGETTYSLSTADLTASASDDQGVYAVVFGNEQTTIGQRVAANSNFSIGHGQSFTAPQTGHIQAIKVRFAAAKSNAIMFLYNSGTGSGTAGSVGFPALVQSGIELFASPTGSLTEILLDTPFPVVQGQQYSFVFEGLTHPYYSVTPDAYPGGDFIFDYDLSSGCCTFGDLVFEIDFIGPTEMEVPAGVSVAEIYAVDNFGTYSAVCESAITIDAACTPGTFTEVPMPAADGYCALEDFTLTALAELNDSEEIYWYMGTCADQSLFTGTGSPVFLGTGSSINLQFPDADEDISIVCIVQGPDGCGDGECVSTTLLHETTAPVVAAMNIERMLDANGTVTILPEEVFDAANSSDNCPEIGRAAGPPVVPVSVSPNTFTEAGVYPVTLTARDNFGNTSTAPAEVTISAALPVEWLSFSADAGAKTVDLQWETTTEPDNAGFHIERSPDGNAWAVIAEQAPLESNRYLRIDEAPLTGENYYRIRQTDFDGTVTYSPVRVVTFLGDLARISVRPNPMTDAFTVTVPTSFGEDVDLSLYDLTGRLIQLQTSATSSGTRVETRELASGVYLLRATSRDGKQTQTVRVIRQ